MTNPIANPDQFAAESDVLAMRADPRILAARQQIQALFARGYRDRLPAEAASLLPAFADEYLNNWMFKAAASDAQHPRLVRGFMPAHFWHGHEVVGARTGGDNPDNCYRLAGIEHGTHYRLTGFISGIKPANISFTLTANYGTSQTVQTIEDHELDITVDGSFEILIDDKHLEGSRNHLVTQPGVKFLFIRDSMMDWATETPLELSIERLGDPNADPIGVRTMTDRAIEHALNDLYLYFWFQNVWSGLAANTATVAQSIPGSGGLVTQGISMGSFDLDKNDAAIIDYDPAGAGYVAVQLTEWLYRSLDYHQIQSSLTAAQSSIDKDGRVRLVVARRDPGVWNWLDTGGFAKIFSILRWQKMNPAGRPIDAKLTMTTIDRLRESLPDETRWVGSDERATQLAERLASYRRRII